MLTKRIVICLVALLWVAGQISAAEKPALELDPWGNINCFFLEENELKFSGAGLANAQTLYTFSGEAVAFDAKKVQTRYYLTFALTTPEGGSSIYLTLSKDEGRTFSEPLLVTGEGSNPALAVSGDLLWIAWEGKDGINFSKSEDGGDLFKPHSPLFITGEVLSSPALLIDRFQQVHLSCISQDPDIGLNRIIYTGLASPEPKALFESHDRLLNLSLKPLGDAENGLLISWQNEYMERRDSYFAVSLDGGTDFGKEQLPDLETNILSLGLHNGKLIALTFENGPVAQEIQLTPLAAPEILFPIPDLVLNSTEFILRFASTQGSPLLYRIELYENADLSPVNSWNFEFLPSSPTGESVEYRLPTDLGDGSYSLRVHATDGIRISPTTPSLSFTVDNLPPQLLTLEAERIEKELTLRGKASESPVWLTINCLSVSIEAATFESHFVLEPGQNIFTLLLSDEAGNLYLTSREAYFDPACPEIVLLNPEKGSWFKPESTIIIEARVSDLQADIEDGSEARIMLDGVLLEDLLSYDREESTLFGFVILPAGLENGEHHATIIFCDRSGNEGLATFTLNVDSSPPQLALGPAEPCFTNSLTSVSLPLVDEGAGIDPSGTIISLALTTTLEGGISAEGEKIVFIPSCLLQEGSYEVEIIPRDRTGNIGEPATFTLVVDVTPPELTLLGTHESYTVNNKVIIQGEVADEHPASVAIFNNRNKVEDFPLNGDYFSKEIRLASGSNQIRVEVQDKAGNTTGADLSIHADYVMGESLINQCANGPNPFSPQRQLPGAFSSQGKGMVFSYSLSQPADVKILVYDITGALIWSREIRNTAGGVTAWSGESMFGGVVGNGIYPYVFSARSGELNEIRRGKIIVYQ